jgi:hypothetical protein
MVLTLVLSRSNQSTAAANAARRVTTVKLMVSSSGVVVG